jgi:small subunit ribosomal protein S9
MSKEIYQGTGRRKSSIARVLLSPGKGSFTINGKGYKEYLCRESLTILVNQPMDTVGTINDFDIMANVKGGGLTGQAGAIRLGISRALLKADNNYRGLLKSAGFLTRDSRRVERKKYGQPGARKKFQFSKR